MIDEYPEQGYYPGALVRLAIRFDDPKRKRFNRQFPRYPATALKRKIPRVLDIVQDGADLVLVPRGSKDLAVSPQRQAVSDDQLTQVIDGVIPLNATLSLNGLRTASTLSLEIPYADLPVEPRMVRGVGVEFYLGTLTAEEFRRGISGGLRAGTNGQFVPLNSIPYDYVDGFGRKRTNLRFEGWVDAWEASWSSDGQPTVKLECRDNTTLLIDTEAPQQLTIDPKLPVTRAFADYLAAFPQFFGLRVRYYPDGAEVPIYRKALQKSAFNPRLGPMATGEKMSIWDYFTDVAGAIGHTVRFDGRAIIVQRPRTYYGGQYPPRPDDPFQGRLLPSGRALPFRLFVYGRNILDYSVKRNFTTAGPTTIEVRCYSNTKKRTLVVRYPLKKDRLERGLPGSLLPDEKLVVFRLSGIGDDKTLKIVAQQIYEQLGRNELEVMIHTKNLGSFGGSTLDPDLLDCKPGDTVQLEISDDPTTAEGNTTSAIEREGTVATRAAAFVRELGYSDDFARAYGRAKEAARHQQSFYRVKRMEYRWSMDQGIDVVVTGINYLEVRGDELPEGEVQLSAEDVRAQQAQRAREFPIASHGRRLGG